MVNKLVKCLLAQISKFLNEKQKERKKKGKINARTSLGTILLSNSVCGFQPVSSNAFFFFFSSGGGGAGPETILLNDLTPFIFIIQIRVCLAYLFHKKPLKPLSLMK